MKRLLQLTILGILISCCALPVLAQNAGFDLLQTGSGASVDLTSMNLGVVPLHGMAITGSLGNTDTIIQRTANGPGQVPIHVYALFMKSTNPVTFQSQSCDVYVTINNSGGNISTSVLPQPDTLSGSTGTVTITSNGSSGGTFNSSFTVNADLIFVKAGTSVTNSGNWVGHKAAPSNSMSSTNSTWTTTAPPGYPSSSSYPSGGFYPKPVHTGPHPVVPASCGSGIQPSSASPSAAIAVQQCIAVAQ
ncbi:MAG TPA: hypothetical protein VKW06_06640 [Candidatus Angelobacter sp.]|nr:hypothetical protein [Candidatus Angelobacter sp.]